MYRLESIGKFALGILLGFIFSIGSLFLLISWIVDSLQSWQFTFLIIVTFLITLGVVQYSGRKEKYSFQHWEEYAQFFLLGGVLGVLSFPQEFTNYRPLTILMVVLFSGSIFIQKELIKTFSNNEVLKFLIKNFHLVDALILEEKDLLNSQKYSDEILGHIKKKKANSQSKISILINGEWGVGKTFMIENILIPELKSNEDIEYVHFQSQKVYFHQEYALINLLKQMQESILEESNLGYSTKYKIYRAFQTWVNALSPRVKFSFLEFSPAIENVKIDKAVEEINKAFEKEGKFLVIIIDDVDRLPIDVAKEFFDLVSYLQNFSRMIPIIVFDKENLGRVYDTVETEVQIPNKIDSYESLQDAIPVKHRMTTKVSPEEEIFRNLRVPKVKTTRNNNYENFSQYVLKSISHQVNFQILKLEDVLEYIKVKGTFENEVLEKLIEEIEFFYIHYPGLTQEYILNPRNIDFIIENIGKLLNIKKDGVNISLFDIDLKALIATLLIYYQYPKVFSIIYLQRNYFLPEFKKFINPHNKVEGKYLAPSNAYLKLLSEIDERCAVLTNYLFLNVYEKEGFGGSEIEKEYGKIQLIIGEKNNSANLIRGNFMQVKGRSDYRLNNQSLELSNFDKIGNFDLILEFILSKTYDKQLYKCYEYNQSNLEKYLSNINLRLIIKGNYLKKFRHDEFGKAELPASEFILHIGNNEKQVLEKKSLEDVVKDLIQCFPLGTVVSYEDSNQFAEVEVDMYTAIGKLIRYEALYNRKEKSELNPVVERVIEAIIEQNINPLMQIYKLGQLWYWTKIEERKDGFTSIVDRAYGILKKEFIDKEIDIFEKLKELSHEDLFEIYNSDDILPQSERDRIVELYRNGKTFRYIWYESNLSGTELDAFKNYLKNCFKTDSNAFERYFLMFLRYNHHSMDSNTKLIFIYDNQTLSSSEIQKIFEEIKRRREANPIPNFHVPYLEREYTEIKDEFYNAIQRWLDRNLSSETIEGVKKRL